MIHRIAHRLLVILDLIVAVTAIAGGAVLAVSAVVPSWSTILAPPPEYLEGSPFGSYLVPGLALAVLLGGLHLVAAVLLLRRSRIRFIAATVAAYAMLIWIFVQMIVIPFSFLQAVYIAAGLAELGLVLLSLGLFSRLAPHPPVE
ncbi:MAG: hypothetical protein ACTHKX_10815 [Pseudolysinimonas sp.]